MAQARARSDAEVSLFPFLSILVCLIGALVLLIVILTAVQSQLGDGRTQEEMQRAMDAQRLKKQTAQDLEAARLIKSISPGAKAKDELDARLKAIVELRKEMETSAETAKKNKETDAALQKELENIVIQLTEMEREKAPITKEIEALKAALAKRKMKPDDAPPAVIVQPGGTGAAEVAKLAFVECTGAGIVMHTSKVEQKRITAASIGTDAEYDAFLDAVRKRNGSVLFLIREDGLGSYNRAAGWAEGQFNLKTGKLPLPGKGPADLTAFFGK